MYFLTARSHQRQPLFGAVRDGAVELNEFGRIVHAVWTDLPVRFPHVHPRDFVVMPDHCHGILTIVGAGFPRPVDAAADGSNGWGPPSGSLGQIVAYLKYTSTVRINASRRSPGIPVWQRDYWDRAIRDPDELERIRAYIVENPQRWGATR